jgi:hypothetical protein
MTGKAADRALANAISQRIAVTYSLAPVRAASTGSRGSAKAYRKHQPAARRQAAPQAAAKSAGPAAEPIIIPSEAALTVYAARAASFEDGNERRKDAGALRGHGNHELQLTDRVLRTAARGSSSRCAIFGDVGRRTLRHPANANLIAGRARRDTPAAAG